MKANEKEMAVLTNYKYLYWIMKDVAKSKSMVSAYGLFFIFAVMLSASTGSIEPSIWMALGALVVTITCTVWLASTSQAKSNYLKHQGMVS